MAVPEPKFDKNDSVPGLDDYRIVDKDGSTTPAGPAEPLGRGAAGIVYRADYKGLGRAIKFRKRSAPPWESTAVSLCSRPRRGTTAA
jgi:hypothetical protein